MNLKAYIKKNVSAKAIEIIKTCREMGMTGKETLKELNAEGELMVGRQFNEGEISNVAIHFLGMPRKHKSREQTGEKKKISKQAAIKMAIEMRASGKRWKAIASAINREGGLNSNGEKWSATSLPLAIRRMNETTKKEKSGTVRIPIEKNSSSEISSYLMGENMDIFKHLLDSNMNADMKIKVIEALMMQSGRG